jgi:hypothetical protein
MQAVAYGHCVSSNMHTLARHTCATEFDALRACAQSTRVLKK